MSDPARVEAAARKVAEGWGYRFTKPTLLVEALTHASAQDGRPGLPINERLEFLGDRVLGLIVATHLFGAYPEAGENRLAPRLNGVVNRGACAKAAKRAGLGPALWLSPAEERSGGREKEAILADACEAVIAALFLDGGLPAAEAFVLRFFADELTEAAAPAQDPKTALQEWAAARRYGPVVYQVVERTGPDHAPAFVVEASAPPATPARGSGSSKREAERAAARALLKEAGVDV